MDTAALLIATFGMGSLLLSLAKCTINKRKQEKETYQPYNP